jgi:hypothetical protein
MPFSTEVREVPPSDSAERRAYEWWTSRIDTAMVSALGAVVIVTPRML